MNLEQFDLIITPQQSGMRVDACVAAMLSEEGISRSFIQKLIADGALLVNSRTCASNYKVKAGDLISVCVPRDEEISAQPENIPLDIIYEDSEIIIVNKRRGMVVHPAAGNISGTLVNALLYACSDLSDINGVIRPGIVHRIDKDTTGLIAVAKSNKAHISLSQQLLTHSLSRIYLAVAEGVIDNEKGIIDAPIGRHASDRKKMCVNLKNGRDAITHYEVLKRFRDASFIQCRLETGRTHQIRVHMAYINHPITGDPVYGRRNSRGMTGQALHAHKLMLVHPSSGEQMEFTAPLPADFEALLSRLE